MTDSDPAKQRFLMSRTEFLRGAVALTGAATVAAATKSAAAAPAAKAAAAGGAHKLKISAFVKFIQDMAYGDMANFLADAGFDGVELPVRANGYILPAKVDEQLPRLVEALDRRGLKVYTVTTDIISVETPDAERVLRAARKLGIGRYRLGFIKYDLAKPVADQLEALRPSIRTLAALNQSIGITGVYQNHGGADFVGAALWDYYSLIRDIPREQLSFVYDTWHATAEGGHMWETTLNLAQSHLDLVSVKDFKWVAGEVQGVPLGQGAVSPRMFELLRRNYRGEYSLHVEYLEHAGGDANRRAMVNDIATLRRLLGDGASA